MQDYEFAVDCYTSALLTPPVTSRAQILTNRALVSSSVYLVVPPSFSHLLNLQCHYRLGQFESAAEDAEAALEMDQTNIKAHFRAALSYLIQSNPDKALQHLEVCLDSKDSIGQFQSTLGHASAQFKLTQVAGPDDDLISDLISILEDDIDGSPDADVDYALRQLDKVLGDQEALPLLKAQRLKTFQERNGYPLILAMLSSKPYTQLAINVLKALSIENDMLVWPPVVYHRLMSAVTNAVDGDQEIAAELLLWAASKDAWVREQFLPHHRIGHKSSSSSSSSSSRSDSLLGLLFAAFENPEIIVKWTPLTVQRLSQLIVAASDGVETLPCQPIRALLASLNILEDHSDKAGNRVGSKTDEIASHQGYGGPDQEAPDHQQSQVLQQDEASALQALKHKRMAVFNERVVSMQHSIVQAVGTLMLQSKSLLTSEMTCWDSKTNKVKPGPLIPMLLGFVKRLHGNSPKKTAPVLGPDGLPRAYTKRPFAADFKDNPAGDFLAELSLGDDDRLEGLPKVHAHREGGQPTLLEASLRLILQIATPCGGGTPTTACTILYRNDILGMCESLGMYTTEVIVTLGQHIAANVMEQCPSAMEEAISNCGQGGRLHSLVGFVRYSSHDNAAVLKVLDTLCGVVDTCSGEDFEQLASLCSDVWRRQHVLSDDDHQLHCIHYIRLCLERAQRVQGLRPTQCPKGLVWDAIGRQVLLKLSQSKRAEGADELSALRKGFLGPSSAAIGSPRTVVAVPRSEKCHTSTYPSGAVITELHEDILEVKEDRHQRRGSEPQKEKESSLHHPVAAADGDDDDEEEEQGDDTIEDLNDIFDSTHAISTVTRQARSEWMNIEESQKVRWVQTSTDVNLWVVIPRGTRASEVKIDVRNSMSLTIQLNWYGTILNCSLFKPIKQSELYWCLEDTDLHLILPKQDGSWWKSLFEGSEERSYHQLLQDAVDADEPVVPYEQLDPDAKELLESILERQAMINEGMIDPVNGFDDFRVVIGENSL